MPGIRTVLGDIAAEEAGVTLTHEHIRYAYQGCEFDHNSVWDLDRVSDEVGRAARELKSEYGVRTMVDLTPPDIGRHPELLARISRNHRWMHIEKLQEFDGDLGFTRDQGEN